MLRSQKASRKSTEVWILSPSRKSRRTARKARALVEGSKQSINHRLVLKAALKPFSDAHAGCLASSSMDLNHLALRWSPGRSGREGGSGASLVDIAAMTVI